MSLILILLGMIVNIRANPDSLALKRNSIKLDIIPLYAVLFDIRKQVRLGLEYERISLKNYTFGVHLDAGLYDDYTYTKYYDFFNQSNGVQYIKQEVKTYGFHLMPYLNYKLGKKPEKKLQFFTGITSDINLFQKKISAINSQTSEKSDQTFEQFRLGLGVHLGMSYRIGPAFHIEAKSIMIARLLMLQSDSGMKDIKPFKAVWFDDSQRFWFIPQFNLCYDF